MNKYQNRNSDLAQSLIYEINDLTELHSIGIISDVTYIKDICTIAQAIKADISIPNENWAIVRKTDNVVISDCFETPMEAFNKLQTWSNMNQFKIDKI